MTWQERRIVTFLSAVLVVLSAIVLVLLGARYKENRAENEAALGIGSTAPATDPGAYTALSYENGSFTLSFSLDENGNWVWADDPSFPLDNTTILGITSHLASWKPQQTVTDEAVLADELRKNAPDCSAVHLSVDLLGVILRPCSKGYSAVTPKRRTD